MSETIELRDPVHGPIPVAPAELAIIDTPLFQRLRGVKQLGFADRVYPGAVHTRYLHCVGAMHLAGRVFDSLERSTGWLDEDAAARLRQLARLAALLHDLGHAPLSHAAESLMPSRAELGLGRYGIDGAEQASHEEMGLALILDGELTGVIDAGFGAMGINAEQVAAVIEPLETPERGAFVVNGVDHWPLLHALVSGELDVDRMDYLLRDSSFTGTSYGRYDLGWLLSNLTVHTFDSRAHLALDRRAVPTFEHFLLARYHMFQMVYFHPKSDIYDAMLRRWLTSVGPDARIPADPKAFVACDDAWLLRQVADSYDPWARRIREHDPYRLVAELRGEPDSPTRQDVEERLATAGIEGLWLTARPVLSRYARAPSHLRTNPLFVRERLGGIRDRFQPIEAVTDLFDRYDRQLSIERLYTRSEDRLRAAQLVYG